MSYWARGAHLQNSLQAGSFRHTIDGLRLQRPQLLRLPPMLPVDDGGAGDFAVALDAGTDAAGAADVADLSLVLHDLAAYDDCGGAAGDGDCVGETCLLK